jgi:hypothetical protein
MAWAAKGGVCRAKSPENPEEIKNFNEMRDGGRGWLVRSECELAGRNKAGMRGMCGPFGGGWTQEKHSGIIFTVSRALDCDVCVCSDRDTGLTGCIILIREARVARGFGLGGQDIRRYPGARTFSLVGRVDNRLGQLFCGRSGLSSRAARQQDSKAEKEKLKLASDPGTWLSLNLFLSVFIFVFVEDFKLL